MPDDRPRDPRDPVVLLFSLTALVGVGLAGLTFGSTPATGVAWAMAGVGVMIFLWSRFLGRRAVAPLEGAARRLAIVAWFALAFVAWWFAGNPLVGTVLVVPVTLELTRPSP